MNRLHHHRGTTTGNRCLIAKCVLDFDGLRSWTPVLRAGYPRLFPAGAGCRLQGNVKSKSPQKSNDTTGLICPTGPVGLRVSESQSHGVSESSSLGVLYVPQVLQETPPAKFGTLQSVCEEALKLGIKSDCMFNLARALKAFEERTETVLPKQEYSSLLRLWWVKAQLPSSAQFGEYLDLLILGYETARTALGSHVLDSAAENVSVLPANPTYEQRIARLFAVCRNLSKISEDGTFFLSRRHAGELLGNTNPHFANNVMRVLVIKGNLIELTKGTAKGRRATRYKIGKPPA